MAKSKVQINQASREELAELPGIGPATADTLIKLRDERGGFKKLEDLEEVSGIGTQTLEALRAHVTVSSNGAPAARKAKETASKGAAEAERATEEAPAAAAETVAKAAGTASRQVETGTRIAATNGEAAADKVVEVARVQADAAREIGAAQADTVRRVAEAGSAKVGHAVYEVVDAQHDALGTIREVQEAWLGLVQEQITANVQTARRLVECRTPQDLASLQSEYLRGSMERLVQGSVKVASPMAHLAGALWSPTRWQQMVQR